MADFTLADYLQGRRQNALTGDEAMWWATPPNALAPYSYAPSEYTTDREMRQEHASQRFGRDINAPVWSQFRDRLPLLLNALRTPVGSMRMAATPRQPGPWGPQPPPTPMRPRPQPGDNGAGQHLYEGLLGRIRTRPDMPAEPGSGWWTPGGLPIPRPSNVAPWLAAGGAGYGAWNLLGGPEVWEKFMDTPMYPPWRGATNTEIRRAKEYGASGY